jgi:hypothetical protein
MPLNLILSLLFFSCGPNPNSRQDLSLTHGEMGGLKEEETQAEFKTHGLPQAQSCQSTAVGNCKHTFPNHYLPSKPASEDTMTTCDFATLKDMVAQGGVINIDCSGTIVFTETLQVTTDTWLQVINSNSVVLDGNSTYRLFLVSNQVDFKVENLTIQNGKTQGSTRDDQRGGAIFQGWKGDLWVKNCTFLNNVAVSSGTFLDIGGGAIYTRSGGRHVIEDSVFTGNQAGAGGAVYTLLSNLTLLNNTFQNNSATDTQHGFGGGAVQTDGALSVEADGSDIGDNPEEIRACGNAFIENSSQQVAGAAFFYTWGQNQVHLYDNTFQNNTAAEVGGAVRICGKTVNIVRNSFYENTAGSFGGALNILKTQNSPSDPSTTPDVTTTIRSSFFAKNLTTANGGAIGAFNAKNTRIYFSTFVQNEADGTTGAIVGTASDSDAFFMENNLFASNISKLNWIYHCNSQIGKIQGNKSSLIVPTPPNTYHSDECNALIQNHTVTWTAATDGFHKYLTNDLSTNEGCCSNNLFNEHSVSCYGAI